MNITAQQVFEAFITIIKSNPDYERWYTELPRTWKLLSEEQKKHFSSMARNVNFIEEKEKDIWISMYKNSEN